MTLYLIRVTRALAERIQAEPRLLEQVWGEGDVSNPEIAGLDLDNDALMEDYLGLGRVLAEEPQRYPWMERALQGTGQEVGFEFGYGPGFVVTPQEAAEIAAGLASEGWWQAGDEVETVPQAIASFYAGQHATSAAS
jgi:hypothetical protein